MGSESAREILWAAEPLASYEAPQVELRPPSWADLYRELRDGEATADRCEALLCRAAALYGALEVSIAEGLHALQKGNRLVELGCHLDDHAREVLGIGKRPAQQLARLGRELAMRPLLREALRSGRVRRRAAQTILLVALGADEAGWVALAEELTVRELELRVRRATGGAINDDDEGYAGICELMRPEERAVVDQALALAAEVQPGASRIGQLEAIAQEFVAAFPDEGTVVGTLRLFTARPEQPDAARAAALETETYRWAHLPEVDVVPAPDVDFDALTTTKEVDEQLRELGRLRADWDDIVGLCAYAVRKSELYLQLGFASFRHYCEERLGLPARTVEQRAAVEERRWASPALQEAQRQGLSFEKLRLLSRLPEAEIVTWTRKARDLTCIALRRELEDRHARQMRSRGRIKFVLPLRVAELVRAAVRTVCGLMGRSIRPGTCLAIMAVHFIDTWLSSVPAPTRARRVRDRDKGVCQVPGCSHRAVQSHHVEFRSHGGSDELENQTGLCAFHHLRCIHEGTLRVEGVAPDALRWFLNGEAWTGPRGADRPPRVGAKDEP